MKSIYRGEYGDPATLELRDVPMPTVGDDAVLVRVHASSVNALDWHELRGKPYIARPGNGFRRPKEHTLGVDVAGVVEAVGANVTDLAVGDRVFGSKSGAFAEYVAARNVVPIPPRLSFEEAAAVPCAGQTALQALRDKASLKPRERVLVNGAGGGVGTFAVQIAKALGGHVTAVTKAENLELMRSLGADETIDYARDDFTRLGRTYDVIVDVGASHSLGAMRRVLAPGGRLVIVGPGRGNWIGPIMRVVGAALRSRLTGEKLLPFLSFVDRGNLFVLRDLLEAGKIRPVIDRVYSLRDTSDAIRHVEEGRARGKVVIRVAD